jgi:Cu+-exporting ATPase
MRSSSAPKGKSEGPAGHGTSSKSLGLRDDIFRAAAVGVAGALALLASYFGLLPLVTNWSFTLEQFGTYWPFITALATGFGVQVALFVYLRRLVRGCPAHGKVVAVSGSASATAMASCCTHYFANVLPILGVTRLVALVAQYQVALLWVGLAFNAAGIVYIGTKVALATKRQARCVAPT